MVMMAQRASKSLGTGIRCSCSVSFAVAMVNFSGGMRVMSWLSSLPWSAPGGLERASAGMFVFPGIYWIS